MGSSVSKWSETNNTTISSPKNKKMSDREIMNAKMLGKDYIDDESKISITKKKFVEFVKELGLK